MADAKVTFITCDQTPYVTRTLSDGSFAFNPYSPTSATIDYQKVLPSNQPVLVIVQPSAAATYQAPVYFTFGHSYSQKCSIPFDNQVQSEPCSRDLLVYFDSVTYQGGAPLPATYNDATVRTNVHGVGYVWSNQQVIDQFNANCYAYLGSHP